MTVNASEMPFKGTYMGLGVGVSSQVLKNESLGFINMPGAFDLKINQKTKGTSADPLAVDFNLGYSTVFEKFYSAIEARFGVQRFKSTQ
jgi:hypothetical protein